LGIPCGRPFEELPQLVHRGGSVACYIGRVEKPEFEARVEYEDGVGRVVLAGDIDLTAVPEVFACIQEADRTGAGRLIVLMHDVTLIDSSGIGVFAGWRRPMSRSRSAGREAWCGAPSTSAGSPCRRTSASPTMHLAESEKCAVRWDRSHCP